VPIIGALFWHAFNHPKSFSKLASVLRKVSFACIWLYIAWGVGYQFGIQAAIKVAEDKGGVPLVKDVDTMFSILPFSIFCLFVFATFLLEEVHKLKDVDDK
jgi:hypothetical protein